MSTPLPDGAPTSAGSAARGSAKEKAQVATIAAHRDASIGDLVAQAVERVGAAGVASVEEAKGTETTIDVVEGTRSDRGHLSPYFVTNAEKMEVTLDEPFILPYERRVANMKHLVPPRAAAR